MILYTASGSTDARHRLSAADACEIACFPAPRSARSPAANAEPEPPQRLGTNDDEHRIDGRWPEHERLCSIHFPPFLRRVLATRQYGPPLDRTRALAGRSLATMPPDRSGFPTRSASLPGGYPGIERPRSSSMATCSLLARAHGRWRAVKEGRRGIALGLIKEGDKTPIRSADLRHEDHLAT